MEQQFLSNHRHEGQAWMSCALCRSLNQSKSLLYRTKQRRVNWSQSAESQQKKDSAEFTSVNDAFSSMLQYMDTTSRQCNKFYKTCAPRSISHTDVDHLARFHPRSGGRQHHSQNPLVNAEAVHVEVPPGTYAVTLGEWSTGQQQKHIVSVNNGQSVDLRFVI